MVTMLGWLSAEMARASCSNRFRRENFGQLRRQDFDGDETFEPRVFSEIDLAHPAGAQAREDTVVGNC